MSASSGPQRPSESSPSAPVSQPLVLSDRQRRILAGLQKDAPEIADMYMAGLRIIADPGFPARVYLAGHALREIVNRLPNHLGIETPKSVEYEGLVRRVSARWTTAVRPRLDTVAARPTTSPPEVAVPIDVARNLDELVRRYEASVGKRREAYVRFLSLGDPTAGSTPHPEPVVQQWLSISTEGHKFAHMRDGTATPPPMDECLETWHLMEDLLHSRFAPMHVTVPEVEELLEEANAGVD